MKKTFTICFVLILLQFNVRAQYYTYCNLRISVQNTANSSMEQTVVGFNPNATDSFSSSFDTVNKSPATPGSLALYTLNSGQQMSTNIMNSVITVPTITMGFLPGSTGNFVMSFKGTKTFDPTTCLYLEDRRTNTIYDMRSGNYNFSADSGENPNRFILHFTPPAILTSTDATCDFPGTINISQPGMVSWNYVLADGSGDFNITGVLNANNPISVNAPANSYILILTDSNNYKATKTIAVGGPKTITAGFTILSSVVTVEKPISFTNTSINADSYGSYSWDFGDGTTVTGVNNATHTYTTAGNYTVTLTVTNGPGCSASTSQTITVSSIATGISEPGADNIGMWSYGNRIYVDFTRMGEVNAIIKICDVLGREISNDNFVNTSIYQKELNSINSDYVIVTVTAAGKTTTGKLFISGRN